MRPKLDLAAMIWLVMGLPMLPVAPMMRILEGIVSSLIYRYSTKVKTGIKICSTDISSPSNPFSSRIACRFRAKTEVGDITVPRWSYSLRGCVECTNSPWLFHRPLRLVCITKSTLAEYTAL